MAKRNSVTMVRETERKYEAVDDWELVDPAGSLGFAAGPGPDEQELATVYYDTADLRLIREGITLRRREGGSDPGWHLKLPAGTDSRQELRRPLGGSVRRPPAELVGLTRVYTRGAALAPVAELTTRRRRWLLADAGGQAIAELVDDHVIARSMGEQTTTVSWREVEVELAEPTHTKLLDRIERRLLQTGAQRAGSSSKLGRLLADRIPAGTSTAKAKRSRSAGDVVLAYLAAQVAQLRRYDPLVRQDAPDAVHQMRVAARRMRSALQALVAFSTGTTPATSSRS
jgi:inorganic triphosphatase YgiF